MFTPWRAYGTEWTSQRFLEFFLVLNFMQPGALSFIWKKPFLLEMVKNDICFGSTSKQNALYSKNITMTPMSRIVRVLILGRWRFNGTGKNASMFACNKLAKCIPIAAGIHEVLWASLVVSRGKDPEVPACLI